MLKDILQKFEKLPESQKRFLSSPMVLAVLEELEKKYELKLALALMEIAVDGEKFESLADFLERRFSLEKETAREISQELKSRILDEFEKIKTTDKNKKNRQFSDISSFDFNRKLSEKSKALINKKDKKQEITILPEVKETVSPTVSSLKKSLNDEKKVSKEQDPVMSEISNANSNINSNTKEEIIFNNEDEKEIKEMKERTKKLKPFSKETNWDREAESIIVASGVKTADKILFNRLKNILVSALKGVRNIIDLKDVLKRRREEGGVGLVSETAEKITLLVKERKQALDKGESLKQKNFLEKQTASAAASSPNQELNEVIESVSKEEKEIAGFFGGGEETVYRFKESEEEKVSQPQEKKENKPNNKNSFDFSKASFSPSSVIEDNPNFSKEDVKPEIKKNNFSPDFSEEKTKTKSSFSEFLKEKMGVKDNQAEFKGSFKKVIGKKNENDFSFEKNKSFSQEKPKKEKSGDFQKVKMEDIKKVDSLSLEKDSHSLLVDPIKEIQDLTLEDFRNFSSDPSVAAEKIKEKINILAAESLEKGVLAVKAWKNSEINKMYLNILSNAMIKHLPVYEIIEEMKKERKAVLNEKEFEAIAELNRNLRF